MGSKFDVSQFSSIPFSERVEKPWGYEIHWAPANLPYMGKILHINAGKRLSLQRHDMKRETWYMMSGKAKVVWDNEKEELIETELEYGKGYTCAIGQRHRLVGITDCDIIEVSTPEIGTTERLEDDYHRPNETEEVRKQKNRGWSNK
ncbi:MAG: cupin [Patescibacteria group bacterium]|jgi:mannose-6-phosphate isomerase-like protein (cupin superfamily)